MRFAKSKVLQSRISLKSLKGGRMISKMTY